MFSGVIRVDLARQPVLRAAYGPASRAWGIRCSLDTRFDTASITKLFTAVAMLQQVEAGAFDLGISVVDYLQLADTTLSSSIMPYHFAHSHFRHRR